MHQPSACMLRPLLAAAAQPNSACLIHASNATALALGQPTLACTQLTWYRPAVAACYSSAAPPVPVPAAGFGPPPPLPTRRVVVTGIGLVTPLAVGAAASWRLLLEGASGIRQLTPDDLPEEQRRGLPQLASRVAGLVPREQLAAAAKQLGEDARRLSPFMLYGLLAAAEALADARWAPSSGSQRQATGVSFGNGMSSTSEVWEAGRLVAEGRGRRVSPFFVPRILPNMAAGAISIRFGLQGPSCAPSTACASGGHALGEAFRIIQRGDADVMVGGASEACVDAISLTGFSRLKALSTAHNEDPSQASRPFDKARDGFVMGEGAGALVLEEEGHALARGARVYAEVRGCGLSSDGHHITHPHPDGLGARLAIERALAGSGLRAEDVVHVNAHATSTPAGDEIEQAAILAALGPACAQRVAVSSTKGATGHLLGAAGAVEAAFTVLALHHRMAPPTLNLRDPDPPLLPGLVGPAAVALPPYGPIAALSNSFGFGGTNTSLLLASV